MRSIGGALLLLMLCAIAWATEGDVKRGEYLARAGDCISCHSNGAGAPFTGGLPMHTCAPVGEMRLHREFLRR